jgi:hypothetical protein
MGKFSRQKRAREYDDLMDKAGLAMYLERDRLERSRKSERDRGVF